jgi:hypothetical protein
MGSGRHRERIPTNKMSSVDIRPVGVVGPYSAGVVAAPATPRYHSTATNVSDSFVVVVLVTMAGQEGRRRDRVR